MRGNRSLHYAALAGLLTAGFGAGRWSPAPVPPPVDPRDMARNLARADMRLAEQVGPSVVTVKTYTRTSRSRKDGLAGSGVIVSPDGLVVTNNHVVRDADDLEVIFTDGRRLEARVVGTDEDTDLAVLRVKARGLVHAPLDPDIRADVGEIVLAMGNPLGLGHSVTSGIISGLDRTDLNIAFYEDFIQTDAAINPGNSGGPLINLEGQVIGINTAMGLASNGDDGIGFAIPSRMVRRVMDDILKYGRVKRGFLGVRCYRKWYARRRIEYFREAGFTGVSRIVVDEVEESTPAAHAGVAKEDIILAINGLRITDETSFKTAIADVSPGIPTTVKVWRDGKQLELRVTMALRE